MLARRGTPRRFLNETPSFTTHEWPSQRYFAGGKFNCSRSFRTFKKIRQKYTRKESAASRRLMDVRVARQGFRWGHMLFDSRSPSRSSAQGTIVLPLPSRPRRRVQRRLDADQQNLLHYLRGVCKLNGRTEPILVLTGALN